MRRLVLALSVATATAFAGPAAGQVELECLSNPLPAHCVSFAFSVDVSTVADPGMLFGPLLPGDTITGTLTLNTAIPDIDPDSGRGAYTNALECASVELADRQVAIVLSPVEPDLDPNDSDPAVKVLNDAESSGGGLTLITDAVTGTAAGLSAIDVFSIPGLNFRGLAGIGIGYGDSCVQGFPFPCPPDVVTDDSIPDAPPGDVTEFATAQFDLQFTELDNTTGFLFGEFTSIDAAGAVPCPEPGFALSLASALLCLAGLARHRR